MTQSLFVRNPNAFIVFEPGTLKGAAVQPKQYETDRAMMMVRLYFFVERHYVCGSRATLTNIVPFDYMVCNAFKVC